ncbi:hypothetical protein CYMTET_48172 [Cymbomonas tetramitiformis]|uniref:Uncharacterized protein n=1 Tax=Cymbomonas tetramitiformis TaxID=36881 RepID=A0AAE0EX02_9CHLO|nr:hypothetical protein CYMTET_48172 [Cymbomonas tetramitiformis]
MPSGKQKEGVANSDGWACKELHKKSMDCLLKNNCDKTKCAIEFQAYSDCKQAENEERRNNPKKTLWYATESACSHHVLQTARFLLLKCLLQALFGGYLSREEDDRTSLTTVSLLNNRNSRLHQQSGFHASWMDFSWRLPPCSPFKALTEEIKLQYLGWTSCLLEDSQQDSEWTPIYHRILKFFATITCLKHCPRAKRMM